MAAANAAVPVTVQSGGAATLDGVQHFLLGPGQPGATAFAEALALGGHRERCVRCGYRGHSFNSCLMGSSL